MKKYLKHALLVSMLSGVIYSPSLVSAANADVMPSYDLDATVVTATRTAKTELDTPASMAVLSEQQLKDTGAENMQTALAKVPGIAYKSFGPNGSAMGGMFNEVAIRGVSNGTLVLLNGAPLNQQGKYYLDAIPVNTVRKVEIIKGGSSVLYGNEAMAGVINIITKKDFNNNIGMGIGNYGQRYYQVQAGADKVNVSYTKQKWGNVDDIIDSFADKPKNVAIKGANEIQKRTDSTGSTKEALSLTYNINDKLDFLYNHYKTNTDYETYFNNPADPTWVADKSGNTPSGNLPPAKALQGINHYENTQDYAQLIYRNNKLKANLYYNGSKLSSNSIDYWSGRTLKEEKQKFETKEQKYKTYGLDVHKKFDITKDKNLVAGASYEKQSMTESDSPTRSRNVYSLYSQWDQNLNDSNEFLFGLRGTWTHADIDKFNYHNLSGSAAFIHKLNKDESVYVNVAQSFIMPTFKQMYGLSDKAVGNPDLKPQKGINYEIGWKKKHNDHNWKVALYKINIKDNITAFVPRGEKRIEYQNDEFKNMGIELSDNITTNKNLSYNWGVSYGNPMTKSDKKDKKYWDRKYGRWQLTGGVNYQNKKLTSSLQGTYLADRVTTPSTKHSYKVKPYFLTSLTTIYKPDDRSSLTLGIDNLLNRRDNVGYSGSVFNTVGRNFHLNYNYTF